MFHGCHPDGGCVTSRVNQDASGLAMQGARIQALKRGDEVPIDWFSRGTKLPPVAIFKILESLGYDLKLLRVNKHMLAFPDRERSKFFSTGLDGRMAHELVTSDRRGTRAASWLGPDYVALNVDKIVDVVAGRPGPHARWLGNAIMAIARDPESPTHAAMLVRASYIRDVTERGYEQDRRDAAAALFEALRPSIEREIRKESMWGVGLFNENDDMRSLVDKIGRNSLVSVRGALAAYPDEDFVMNWHVAYDDPLQSMRKNLVLYMSSVSFDPRASRQGVLDTFGPISFWRTSGVTDLGGLFDPNAYRQPAGQRGDEIYEESAEGVVRDIMNFSANLYWDTRNVADMSSTFARSSFNGRIGHLNVSRVTTFAGTFHENDAFDQPLDAWDVSSARDMSRMFAVAHAFDRPLASWDVSRVRSFEFMFSYSGFRQYKSLRPWRLHPHATIEDMFNEEALDEDRTHDLLHWLARDSPGGADLISRARRAIGFT
jgi:hypothetical protein